ncbi:MAG TPA: immunoglobulin-like domain-containing protein, partial [Bacteroidales bacterium]|nr:immunoglobulin-like domain-containing protein [Bacteroidales bacterium]
TLNDFTISTYIYIDPATDLSHNGNFIWTFSNSDDIVNHPDGCMFFSAKDTRYAISPTNWSQEKVVGVSSESPKGEWVHYTITQKGNVATIYINGISKATNTNLDLFPSALGATTFNFLGKSAYTGDNYLSNTLYYDFRVYDQALSADSIAVMQSQRKFLDTLIYNDIVNAGLDSLQLDDTDYVTEDINLPQTEGNISVSWQSSNPSIISNDGIVQRPSFNSDTAFVTLTATLTCNFVTSSKSFEVRVIPHRSDSASVASDYEDLHLSGNLDNLRSDIVLPLTGNEGSIISWSSDQPDYISNNGEILDRLPKGEGKLNVILTATIHKGDVVKYKTFEIHLAEDEGFSGYLFAYFTGNSGDQEAIRFALSDDGLTYNALNNNNPILNSADISRKGGVRDPHILRGVDGTFYMVATDMVSANGWSSNRGIVMLRSDDLIHWTSSTVNLPESYPSEYGTVTRVWAPETIYDPVNDKYMIYFSINKGGGDYDKIYYAYANSSFTGFEKAPALLFDHNGYSSIDATIVLKDGIYNLFFKTEGNGNGIQKAISTNLTGPYTSENLYLQPNNNAVEGECVFRLINSDIWYMIYDVYSSGYYEFTQSTDLENFTVVNNASFDFTPRHGTIIPITAEEKTRLQTNTIDYSGETSTYSNLEIYPENRKITQKMIAVNGLHIDCKKKTLIDLYSISGIKMRTLELDAGMNFISVPAGVYIIRKTNE